MNPYIFIFFVIALLVFLAGTAIKIKKEHRKRKEHERWVKKQRYTP